MNARLTARPSTRNLATALVASALLLTACGGSDPAATGDTGSAGTPSASSPHGGGHSGGSTGKSSSDSTKGNDTDVAFLVGMKPHHEQAVELSDIVLAANPPAGVAAIAQQIKGAQAPEIEQMTTMLADLGQSAPAAHGEGHSGGAHGGMMNDADLAALKAATGKEAARLYLEGMVAHHEGAIEAANEEIAEGTYAPALALAKTIAAEQAAEIVTMKKLLSEL